MAGHFFEEYDPLLFASHIQLFFPTTGLNFEGHVSTQSLSAVLPKSNYNHLTTQRQLVVDKAVLTTAKAKTYAEIFRERANVGVPWILGPASLLPQVGALITIATSAIDGYLRLTGGASSVTASQLVVLLANGGVFLKTRSLEKNPKHGELLVENILYNVTVGTENRLFFIRSGRYALIVR